MSVNNLHQKKFCDCPANERDSLLQQLCARLGDELPEKNGLMIILDSSDKWIGYSCLN